MWRFRRNQDGAVPQPVTTGTPGRESPPEPTRDEDKAQRRKQLRRRAGCVIGLLTEPIALIGVTLAALIFGRAFLVRRAEAMRRREQAKEEH